MDKSKARSQIINMEIRLKDIRDELGQLAKDLNDAGYNKASLHLFRAETLGHAMNLLLMKAIGKM